MSENLEGFLVDLSSDPDKLSRFDKNPDAVVSGSPLTEEQKNQVKTRDSRVLADAMGATGFALGEGVGVVTPMRAPARKKRPTKKAPPKKKAPARKKTPARKRAPAKKKTPARKQSPAKRKAPARKKSAARKPARKTTSRKRR
jgi:hypothetical protein